MSVKVDCPRCQAQNAPGTIICSECGLMLVENSAATHKVDGIDPQSRVEWGTRSFVVGPRLTLRIGEAQTFIKVDFASRDCVTIGRRTPESQPDVDLSLYNAQELGVSRLHCKLIAADGKLYLEDLGSVNGTYVNGTRVGKGERRVLVDGNEIMLSRLKVQLFF